MFTSEVLPARRRHRYLDCVRLNLDALPRVRPRLSPACMMVWLWVLASLSISWTEAASSNGVITLGPTNLAAASNVPSGLKDIRGVVDIPSSWLWVWRVLFALALSALGWWAWRLWQKHARKTPTTRLVPADVTARERLREALSLLDQPQPFCFAIAEIIRTYLESQFGLRAPDQTTEEFLADMQKSLVLDHAHKLVLEDFLTRCDLVKFARVEPAREELEDLHQAALRLVDETAGIRPPNLPPNTTSLESPPPLGQEESVVDAIRPPELAGESRYMPRETVGSSRSVDGGKEAP